MVKLSKAQARKRLKEAVNKISKVAASGKITFATADKLVDSLNRQIKRLK